MKYSLRKKMAIAASLMVLAVPVLAQAPQALSIIINGVALQGKALQYKGRLYVPLEDIASATGGTFTTDPKTGVVTATVLTPSGARHGEMQRPFIKVVYERKYTEQSNARVLATIVNQGEKPAENVEMICTFKGNQRELNSYVQNVGTLKPGERRTLEFRLFEAASTPPNYVAPGTLGTVPDDKIFIQGEWQRVSYEFHFNYQ